MPKLAAAWLADDNTARDAGDNLLSGRSDRPAPKQSPLPKEKLTMTTAPPKSYLPPEEREALMREGGMNLVYLTESQEASHAGDEDAAWTWLTLAELPPTALRMLKTWNGPQFIRDMGFKTARADAEYGPDWLDRS